VDYEWTTETVSARESSREFDTYFVYEIWGRSDSN